VQRCTYTMSQMGQFYNWVFKSKVRRDKEAWEKTTMERRITVGNDVSGWGNLDDPFLGDTSASTNFRGPMDLIDKSLIYPS
jgi:hypothetical protein